MTEKLGVYNQAARFLGQTPLVSLSENRGMRTAMDAAWPETFAFVLEHGLWSWAKRATLLVPSDTVLPAFGYTCAFQKPDDWVATDMLAISETMASTPLEDFEEESDYWFANLAGLYVRYVSNDIDFGGNLARWSASGVRALAAQLAFDVCVPILQNKGERDNLWAMAGKLLSDAKSHDQRGGPVRFSKPGRIVRARMGWGTAWSSRR